MPPTPNWLTKFYSDFTSPPSVQTDLGNGSITEAAGVLTLSTASGVDCNWWSSAPYSPLAYDTIEPIHNPLSVVRFETRVSDYLNYSGGLGAIEIMLCLFADRQNMYGFGWSYDLSISSVIRGMRLVNNVGTSIGVSGGGTSSPHDTPHIYRFYWNPSVQRRYVPELGLFMEPNQLRFYYSLDDGSSFIAGVAPYITTLAFAPRRFGVSIKTWNNKPAVDTLFSHLEMTQWDPETELWVPPNGDASFEDQTEFLSVQGEPRHSVLQLDRGPNAVNQARGVLEEQVVFPPVGGIPRHSPEFIDPGKKVSVGSVGLFEEQIEIDIGNPPEFNNLTSDDDGNFHFITATPVRAYRAFFYNTVGERWTNPTSYDFTGYARNGKHYTNGVEDAGPVWAPWATEVFGVDRGTRADFPVKALIVVARQELCIFDLDGFDGSTASLKLWMRFRMGNSSNFYMAGRGDESIRDVKMVNGLLVIGQKHTGWENGRLILIDFKGDDTYNTGNLIGSDNHWRWNGTIAQRHTALFTTSGVSPSLRQNNEYIYSVSPFVDASGVTWVALAGEDDNAVVRIPTTGRPAEVIDVGGPDVGESTSGTGDEDYRYTLIDRLGLLWFTIGTRLFRNFTYQEGVVQADIGKNPAPNGMYRSVEFPGTIKGLAEAQNYIFVAVDGYGIYGVHRGSMEQILAYTPVGGGGEGTRRIAGIGEVFTDLGYPIRKGLVSLSLALSNFLAISTELPGGGVAECTIIRTTDDYAPATFQFPAIVEPRAYWHVIIL